MIPVDILNEAVISIVKEVQSKSVGTITISAVITLWSAGKGFFALCKGLSSAYGVEYKNEFLKYRLRGIIATFIFIIVVVVTLSILVFGNSINMFLKEKFNIFSKIISWLIDRKIVVSVSGLAIMLTVIYRFIPKHSYKIKTHILGAILAAIACNIISIFYSIYVDTFSGFSFMYGSFTTIVLAMLWIYACMYSILLGAVINKILIKNNY